MACDENKYKSIFTLDKYKKYIRDTNYTDDDIYNLIKDVFEEVAFDTRVFKDVFAFTISNRESVYNIKEMYDVFQKFNDDVTIDFVETLEVKQLTDDDIKDILVDPTIQTTSMEATTKEMCYNEYVSTISMCIFNEDTNRLEYIENDWFQLVTQDIYQLNKVLNDGEEYNIITTVHIVPNINNVDKAVEIMCRNAIISGMKFHTNGAYENAQNDQGTNLLYQRYYNARKQLSMDFPNYISDGVVVNPDWNY